MNGDATTNLFQYLCPGLVLLMMTFPAPKVKSRMQRNKTDYTSTKKEKLRLEELQILTCCQTNAHHRKYHADDTRVSFAWKSRTQLLSKLQCEFTEWTV